MTEEYAAKAHEVRRHWDSVKVKHVRTFRQMPYHHVVTTVRDTRELQYTSVQYRADIPIAAFKLMSNIQYAIDNGNKRLVKDNIWSFPVMNYALNEGPYLADPDDVFGREDAHMVFAVGNELVFFYEHDALERGLYVELLR